jgi:hypothetical protein
MMSGELIFSATGKPIDAAAAAASSGVAAAKRDAGSGI